jgi:hypothetical protein
MVFSRWAVHVLHFHQSFLKIIYTFLVDFAVPLLYMNSHCQCSIKLPLSLEQTLRTQHSWVLPSAGPCGSRDRQSRFLSVNQIPLASEWNQTTHSYWMTAHLDLA